MATRIVYRLSNEESGPFEQGLVAPWELPYRPVFRPPGWEEFALYGFHSLRELNLWAWTPAEIWNMRERDIRIHVYRISRWISGSRQIVFDPDASVRLATLPLSYIDPAKHLRHPVESEQIEEFFDSPYEPLAI